ncbi:MAG TPA: Ig-like domain-containing protein, partial [Thermoplasmata archaeon]|nr:Ig-like domain-containing protein [Thermoplasmata archaeon]
MGARAAPFLILGLIVSIFPTATGGATGPDDTPPQLSWQGVAEEVPLPDFKVSDYWEYSTRGWGSGSNPYNSTGTYSSKVEERGTMKVNGSDIDAYRFSSSSKSYYVSVIQGNLYQSWSNSTGQSFSHISNLATANSSGSTVTDTYYLGNKTSTSSLGYTDYDPAYDYYQYPVRENESWNGSSHGWSRTFTGGKWYYTSWDTSFRLHSEGWETVSVPAGSFRSLRVRTEPVNGYFSRMWLSPTAQTTVRAESFDGTGTLTGIQELTKFSSSPPDKVPPRQLGVSPSAGATGVGLDIEVRVKFSEAMDRPKTEAALSVQGATVVSYSWTGDELVATLGTLVKSTTYEATVSASAADSAGNLLDGNGDGVGGDAYSWSFTTGGGGIPSPPKVVAVTPPDAATGVALNSKVSVSFDMAMDRPSVEGAFSLAPATLGSFAWASDSASATYAPDAPLVPSTSYTISISTSARSSAGAALPATVTSKFTTGTSADTERPTVVSFDPSDGKKEVGLDVSIVVEFSEPMQSSTLLMAIKITPSIQVKATVEASRVTLKPDSPLSPETSYLVKVDESAMD